MFSNLSLCLLIFGTLLIDGALSIVLETSGGKVNGNQLRQHDADLYSFKKIPFAQPPIGSLRFAKPVKPNSWDGILDATKYGPACPQNSTTSSYHPDWIDEDCLHVNVFTSKSCLMSRNCSVVFYIHGGGMNFDSPVMFDDEYLFKNFASKDVVLVLSAFRLGFLGLLGVQEEIVPSNLAVYDLIHALEWVQNDIHYFGGNKSDVTLLGHSMGAGTILAISFSKTIDPQRKLFQKAIAMSGDIYLDKKSTYEYITLAFAKETGCLPQNTTIAVLNKKQVASELVNCLKNMEWQEILRAQRTVEENGMKLQGLSFGGALFPGHNMDEFLTDAPAVDKLLIGSTSREMDRTIPSHEVLAAAYMAHEMHYANAIDIGKKYDSDVIHGRLDFYHSIETQAMFLSILSAATKQTEAGANVFLYSYTNPTHPYHVDYLSYLMGVHAFQPDENEAVLAKLIPDLWIDFIKNGKPNQEWKAFNPHVRNYYNLNVNLTGGLTPSNKMFFEKAVYDYWTAEVKNFDAFVSKAGSVKQQVEKKINEGTKLRDILPRAAEYVVLDKDGNTVLDTDIARSKSFGSYVWDVMTYMGFTALGFVFGSIWAAKRQQEEFLKLNDKVPLYNTIMH
ncbi:unnamed protein product [Auanema sp. JU1783]|nr:unnamed protein product [Auanema sp. JU1783]